MVSVLDVQRRAISVGVHSHGFNAQLAAGANHADGDFSSIGDQNTFEHRQALMMSF
jgi:hypothetical protein